MGSEVGRDGQGYVFLWRAVRVHCLMRFIYSVFKITSGVAEDGEFCWKVRNAD
jgi:hypothetical protein